MRSKVARLTGIGRVPPNVKFLVDDIESEWAYENNPFDFIHARNLLCSIRDFGKLIKQCYRYATGPLPCFFLDSLTDNRSVKPGGWVELQDWDGYPYSEDGSLSGTGLQQYYDNVYGAFEQAGYEVRPGVKLEQWFKDAGFVNIHVEMFVVPTASAKGSPSCQFPFVARKVYPNNNPVLTSLCRRKLALGCRPRPKPAMRAWPWPL